MIVFAQLKFNRLQWRCTNNMQLHLSKTTFHPQTRNYFLFRLATGLGYYGLSLQASTLAGNKYLNFFISGAVELPAYLSGVYILSR